VFGIVFRKLVTIIMLIVIYNSMTPLHQQQVKNVIFSVGNALVYGVQLLQEQGKHSTLATEETYCPTDIPQQQYSPYNNGNYNDQGYE